jgi:hypothetical protein
LVRCLGRACRSWCLRLHPRFAHLERTRRRQFRFILRVVQLRWAGIVSRPSPRRRPCPSTGGPPPAANLLNTAFIMLGTVGRNICRRYIVRKTQGRRTARPAPGTVAAAAPPVTHRVVRAWAVTAVPINRLFDQDLAYLIIGQRLGRSQERTNKNQKGAESQEDSSHERIMRHNLRWSARVVIVPSPQGIGRKDGRWRSPSGPWLVTSPATRPKMKKTATIIRAATGGTRPAT